MLRVIIRTDDNTAATYAGGATETIFTTFGLDAPEIESFLKEPKTKKMVYVTRQIIGVEIVGEI